MATLFNRVFLGNTGQLRGRMLDRPRIGVLYRWALMRRVCIAIGVSRAEGLAPLRAAATAAEEIGQWAERSGFARKEDIEVLTDRVEPVTISRIADTFKRLLPLGTHTDALLLHFAGHGLREDATRTLWLPSDWRSELRAIAVERLKNRLSDFGIANVTIISDACKALANDRDTSDLTPDGVLGTGTSAGSRPVFDRFDAVHDVEAAFMIPGPTPAESRCLFSGALIEALWGATDAIDPHYPGKVTPGSLADYLSARVAELCATYQLNCEPQSFAGRPPDHLIYFDRSSVDPAAVPALPPWPAPVAAPALEEMVGEEAAEDAGAAADAKLDWLLARARGEVERSLVANRRADRRRKTADAFNPPVIPPAVQANLLFGGGGAVAVWSSTKAERVGEAQWLASITGQAEQLVVEYADGVFVPLVVYDGLTTIAARDERGTSGWQLRAKHDLEDSARQAASVLGQMQSGELAPGDVHRVAALLRVNKHGNPVLGAVCAYLYDYAGDLDNIRRLASFYVGRFQPIPYDVALMGELRTHCDYRAFNAEVPAVDERPGKAETELPEFTFEATAEAEGAVSGLCPWLRQGWDFVDAPTDREVPLVQGLPPVRQHLLPETFTSFDREGGLIMTNHWQMERYA